MLQKFLYQGSISDQCKTAPNQKKKGKKRKVETTTTTNTPTRNGQFLKIQLYCSISSIHHSAEACLLEVQCPSYEVNTAIHTVCSHLLSPLESHNEVSCLEATVKLIPVVLTCITVFFVICSTVKSSKLLGNCPLLESMSGHKSLSQLGLYIGMSSLEHLFIVLRHFHSADRKFNPGKIIV